MSDIAIPGFSSDSNSAKMIENLLKAKRIPLEKLEITQEEYTNVKGVWQDLRVTFSKLSDSTSKLYGFENPFNEKTVSSTNEEILTAESERSAIDENLSFNIKKLASTDKFVSRQIDADFRIPEGTYKFSINEDETTLKYRGGTAEDFVEKLNKRNPESLRASLIKNSKTTQVLLIESLKTGKENKLEFKSDSVDLGLKLGIIEKNIVENSQIRVDDIIESKGNVDKSEYKLNLAPLSNASFRVKDELNESDIVEITVELVDKNDASNDPNLPLNDLNAPSVTLENITINSEPGKQLDRFLANDESDLPPILDMNVVSVNSGEFDFELEPIINKKEKQILTFSGEDISEMKSINIINNNSNKTLIVHSVIQKKGAGNGDYVPVKPISIASNSKLTMNGMDVERETNEIDDLVDGTKLFLHKAAPDENVSLKIDFNTDLARDQILDFVYNYNQAVQKILILTSDDKAIISEIEFADDKAKEKAEEISGILKGDRTLNSLKQSLVRAVTNSYPTDDSNDYTLLKSIGISTNATGSTGYNAAKLRGYIEADLETLESSLKNNLPSVKKLFGNDTNSDFIIDSGVAKVVDDILNPYTRAGGTIATRVSTIDAQIKRGEKQISDYKDDLISYEEDIRRQYGNMDATINTLNNSMKSIENLTNTGND